MIIKLAICTGFVAATLTASATAQDIKAVPPTFYWMLPRTVLDATVVYTYAGCRKVDGVEYPSIKIATTLVPRGIADKKAGLRQLTTQDLASATEDRNITLTTSAGTMILSSVGGNPVNQTTTIIGNILTGITKIVALGIGAAAVKEDLGKKPDDSCAAQPDQAVKQLKDRIDALEAEIASATTFEVVQRDNAQIQAVQYLLAKEQAKLGLTMHATIDPGYSDSKETPVDTDDPDVHIVQPTNDPVAIPSDLIGSIIPSQKQIVDLLWTKSFPNFSRELMRVSIYLDFEHASMPMKPSPKGYEQTEAGSHDGFITYREVNYIPVVVWQGDRDMKDNKDIAKTPHQLTLGQSIPFAQFGSVQTLPLTAALFKQYKWSVSFTDMGEITNASFNSTATASAMTNLFGSVASAANSIGTEERNISSPSAIAAKLQSQADEIYQKNRLALCEANPASCFK